MESETLSDIPGDILVDIFRFMNRKDLSNIALGNRRWRDISRTHFAQYPLLLLGELSIAKDVFGKREPGLKIDYRWIDMEDDSRGMKDDSVAFNHLATVNWPPLSNPAPAYLRFEKADITAFNLFEKYPQEYTFTVRKLLDILKNLQTAFVDSYLFFGSGPSLGEPFTTRRSLLQFLKVDILPLFPSCREYVLVGLNLEGSEENEIEREPLLLLPDLYNSGAKIVLVFTFHTSIGSEHSARNTFAIPMISIQEVITWLHRPNPEDPSKKRELQLRDETFSYDEFLQANAIKEIKHRLLEIFVSATQRCSYVLEVELFRCGSLSLFSQSWASSSMLELKVLNSITLNDHTGEQFKIYSDCYNDYVHYLIFKRTHQSVSP